MVGWKQVLKTLSSTCIRFGAVVTTRYLRSRARCLQLCSAIQLLSFAQNFHQTFADTDVRSRKHFLDHSRAGTTGGKFSLPYCLHSTVHSHARNPEEIFSGTQHNGFPYTHIHKERREQVHTTVQQKQRETQRVGARFSYKSWMKTPRDASDVYAKRFLEYLRLSTWSTQQKHIHITQITPRSERPSQNPTALSIAIFDFDFCAFSSYRRTAGTLLYTNLTKLACSLSAQNQLSAPALT